MHPLIESLLADGPVITDGAWGTQMQARGLPIGGCPDEWNLTHADAVGQVPQAYVEVGSQIVLTNTFRANRITLADYSLTDKVDAINRAGAQISKTAAGDEGKVFASIGPSGKMLMMGEVSEEELQAAFAEQAVALAAGGADALVIETMTDVAEACLAIKAVKSANLAVVACMCYDSGADLDRTMMGTTPEQAAKQLEDAGADVIGANCGQGIVGYIGICRRLRSATDLPLWIKANAGIPEMVDGEPVYRTTPEEFASHGPALVEAGANFVGGCCGTGPEYIRALAQQVK